MLEKSATTVTSLGHSMGAAHNSCNLGHSFGKTVVNKETKKKEWQMNYKIPVFFHNLKGYDSHFLLHAIQHFDACPSVIAQNSQRMIAFTARSFQFKDSLGFLNDSLVYI